MVTNTKSIKKIKWIIYEFIDLRANYEYNIYFIMLVFYFTLRNTFICFSMIQVVIMINLEITIPQSKIIITILILLNYSLGH